MDDLRTACAVVAARATHVTVNEGAIAAYAPGVVHPGTPQPSSDDTPLEERAAFSLTLNAINFGSGWFPTLRKRDGLSGYNTIAAAWREQATPSAHELASIDAPTVARTLEQDSGHQLMALYAASLRDLAAHVDAEHDGSFAALATSTPSAVALAKHLGSWGCFADNLVPHVLRLDGVLHFDPALTARIDSEELIEPGSPEEVEIRACALHAVELVVAARAATAPVTAAEVDEYLWNRGQQPRYKAVPRHRSRCTAY